MLFSLAGSTFLSLSPVSPAYAQGAAPTFDSTADYTRAVDENTKPYDEDLDYVMIGDPITATGTGIIYSIANARTAHFGINSYTGHLLIGSPLDYETKSSYTVTVVATNNTSDTARQDVTINVNNVDEPGTVTFKWRPSGSDVEFEAMLNDGDEISGTTTWQWSESETGTGTYDDISGATSAPYTNDSNYKHLQATATYTDTHASSKTATATLEVKQPSTLDGYTLKFDVNTSGGYTCPHRNTNTNYNNNNADICVSVQRNVTSGDDIYYPASLKYTHATKDPRYPSLGTISYSLGGGDDAGKFDINPVSGDLLPKGSHEYNSPDSDGVFFVAITATDASGRSASVSIALQPSGSNNNPVVQGPTVIRYPENGTWQVAKYTGKLQGREQDRDVGWIIGVQPGGGDGDFFDIDDDGVLYFDLPPDYEQGQKEYSFSLHAYDTNPPGRGRPGQTFYRVKVIVEDVNDPPEIDGPTNKDFPENSPNAVASYTVEGVDEGQTAHWKLEEGDDASKFSITPSTTGDSPAELRFKSPPDYESFNTAADEHIFLLTIMVEVAGEMKTEHVRVTVTNVNEPPEFATATTTRNVGENAGPNEDIGDPVEATDPDKNDYLDYTLSGTDAASFEILSGSGQLQTKADVDYGSQDRYTVTVTATDSGGLPDTITVTITTQEENDPPVFDDVTLDTELEVAENTAANTNIGDPITATDEDSTSLTYTLEGDDEGSFIIVSTSGQIKTKLDVTYNYEDPGDTDTNNEYMVTVKASDGTASATIDVTIDVTNVEEAGTVTFDQTQHKAGTPLIATLTDPDGYVIGETWEWLSSANANTGFTAITNETSDNYTPTVDDVGKYLRAKASYTDDEGPGKTAEATTTVGVTPANTPPTFPDTDGTLGPDPITFEVAENSAAATFVGTVSATDDDTDDSLIYSLEGTSTEKGAFDTAFMLNSSTGAITVRADESLDHETTVIYTFGIEVSDGKDAAGISDNVFDSTVAVTINVTDVNERPTFDETSPATRTIDENTAAGENLGDPFTATDPEVGDTLTYTLDTADDAIFDIDGSGQLKTEADLDFETTPSYTVTVSVRDSKNADGNQDTATDATIDVTIEVTDVNEPPEFDEGSSATRNVGENAGPNGDFGALVEATDPEDDALNYNLTGTDDYASFEIGLWDGQLRTISGVNYGDKSTYTVTVSVTDLADAEDASDETADDTITVTITTNEENDAPVFDDTDLDTTLEVSENTAATTNIGVPITATDEDNPSLTYTLEGDDKDSFTIVSASGQIQTKSGVTYNYEDPGDADTDNEYLVTVKASDGTASDTIDVTINVTDVNEDPTFNDGASTTRSVAENTGAGQNIGAPVAATDPDNENNPNTQTLTYTLGRADATSFDMETSSGQLQTKAALDHDTKATYTVTVAVSDSKDASGTADSADDDTITVTINVTGVNEPPGFSDETATRTIPENTPANQDIGLPVAATDPDSGDTSVYELDAASDADFDIDASGQLKTEGDLDFETQASYTVTVTATDGSGTSDSILVTIDVTDVNEVPAFDEVDPAIRDIAENTAADIDIGNPVAATDEDGDTLTYTLGGVDAGSFDIDPSSGQLKTQVALDLETESSYAVTVSVSDSKDAGGTADSTVDATIDVTINVTNVNESPFVAETPNTNYAENGSGPVAEYTAEDPDSPTITWAPSGDDGSLFSISAMGKTGVLTFITPPDYEAPADTNGDNVYLLTVTASDEEHGHALSVTVTVTNVDEAGTVTLTSFYPQVNAQLEATLDDPDGETSAVTWSWESSSDRGAWADITGATAAAYTPVAANLGDYLRVTASYTDPEGSGKNAQSETTDPVRAAPVTNTAPTFDAGTTTRTAAENTAAGQNIGSPVTATDTDTNPNDNLTYVLRGTDAASFDIDQTTGQLQTKTALNYEVKNRYTVTVTATDPGGLTATKDVTINVTDVDEPPGKPDAPTVEPASSDGHNTLTVTWTAPTNTGPELTSYTFAHRKHDVEEWTTQTFSITPAIIANPTLNITTLLPETTYLARIQATSDEGTGEWSDEGDGTTGIKPQAEWFALTVDYGATTYDVTERSSVDITVTLSESGLSKAADRKLAIPITVTRGTAESGDYQLSGLTSDALAFVPGEMSQTFTVVAKRDSDRSDETLTLGFGPLPLKVTEGTSTTALVTIDDNTPISSTPPRPVNHRPVFNPGTVQPISVAENTVAGTDIGDPITATDSDANDTLTYSLDAASAKVFTIVAGTGQLQTKAALNYEVKNSYSVMVTARDPGGSTDATTVTINVTDVDEPPGKPDAPTVAAKTDTHAALTVTWTAPTNTGPAIDSYDVEYRKHDVTEWSAVTGPIDGTTTTIDITGLLPDTEYFARVQATNDEGTSAWSDEGSGTTSVKPEADWFELTADYRAAAYTVTEGSSVDITVTLSEGATAKAADRKLAIPITVMAGTAESGDYTVSGLTSGDLAFVPGESSKTFEISALGDSDRADETVDLGFGSPLPDKVIEGTTATSQVTIDDNTRPPGGGGGGGTPPVNNPPVNNAPVFDTSTVETISVAENTVAGTDIGDPIAATDSDANDTLTYSLDATSATVFTIVAGTGQLQTKGALNYEVKNSYTVTVTATDSAGATATTDVTINVTDVDEPPGKPDAPTVGPASTNGHNTLSVSWNAPYNTGPAITSYTVEYRKHDSTQWTSDNLTIAGTTATITGLPPDTRYAATLRATNDEGTGEWSNEGYGSTAAVPVSEHLDLTVSYGAAAYAVNEGSSVTVTVALSVAADRALAIPITITADTAESGDYTAGGLDSSNALAFVSGDSSKSFTITANSDTDTDDETLDLGFGTLPAKVTAGTTPAATVTITDQIMILPQRAVNYGAASYTVNEGSNATINVTLTQAADRALSVPITVTRGTAEARDYEVSGLTGGAVAFSQGADSGNFTITAAQDEDSSNETLTLGFGTLPGGVVAGTRATATVTIDDDDPAVVYNPPPQRRRGGGGSRRRGSGGWVMGSENYPPVFMEGPTASREVPENIGTAANIGYPVTATDPNLDKLTYKLTGDDRDNFDIGPDTGQLLTKAPLDFETRPGYDVGVTVTDGRGGSDSIEVSIGLTDVREILFDRDNQTVARVTPAVGATIITPDGSGTVALPAGSRDSDYYVRIGSGGNDCARNAPAGDLYVYTTVEVFDLQGNLEEDVTLDQPAVILLKLDAGKLGGVADALAIHEAGGIRVYRRAGPQEEWAEVDFTLASDDEGGITVFVTGVLEFGCFVAVADTSVLPPPAPPADPAPEPTPTPQPVVIPMVADVPPAPPAAVTGPKADPVYPPVSTPLSTTPLSIGGAAPLSIFGAVEKFARDIPLWILMMLLIALAAWSVCVYAYDVWRRNHPPPPKWRSDVAEIGRDMLVPTG